MRHGVVRFMVEVFVVDLMTILNACQYFRGFVYQGARFSPDRQSIEVRVRPRQRSVAICSACHCLPNTRP